MIEVKVVETEDDAKLVFFFLASTMYPELSHGVELDPGKALWEILQCAALGAAFFVVEDDVTIASLGLIKTPYWFSQREFITELWFYVRPDKRDGPAFRLLLKEARDLANATGLEAKIHYGTAKTRAAQTPLSREATEFEFWPKRDLVSIAPRTEDDHGQ